MILKRFLYGIYLIALVFFLLEIILRFSTTQNQAGVEFVFWQKSVPLLPMPTSQNLFSQATIKKGSKDLYRVFDDTLGWTHAAWGIDSSLFPCFANDKGLRVPYDEWHNKVEAKKHYDIICIGNSFTHGDAVIAEEAWPNLLMQNMRRTVANLGVGGYGLQQAFLRLMTSGITADTVFFGAVWADFGRAVEPVYKFYEGGNKTRPIFSFNKDNSFHVINLPVMTPEQFYASKKLHDAEIFQHIKGFDSYVFSDDFWTYSYVFRLIVSLNHNRKFINEKPLYLNEGEELNQCVQIFSLFKNYCENNGIYPIVVLLETEMSFYHKEKWVLNNPWDLVKQKLTERGISHIDFHEELFKAYSEKRENVIHPVENLHYSPEGNLLVANLLSQNLISH